jgi:hypothetical protein
MAGRPLRRLRNALRLNPLVGWEDASGIEPRRAKEPHAVLVKPGAEAKYAEVYNRVGLPLVVALHPDNPPPYSWEPDREARVAAWGQAHTRRDVADKQMAKRLNAIVLSIEVKGRGSEPFYATPDQRRGSSDRLSPYTPFVLLHRLGDMVRLNADHPAASKMVAELSWAAGRWRNVLYKGTSSSDTYLSRGVDTAAGRMGVIDDDYLSDLWAKWLLTGRVAYSATTPPPESAEEANFRNMVAEYAPQIFRIWYDYLDRNRPMVITI